MPRTFVRDGLPCDRRYVGSPLPQSALRALTCFDSGLGSEWFGKHMVDLTLEQAGDMFKVSHRAQGPPSLEHDRYLPTWVLTPFHR